MPWSAGWIVPGLCAFFAFGSAAHAGRAYDMISDRPIEKQLDALAKIVESAGDQCSSAARHFYMGERLSTDEGYWTVKCPVGDFLVGVKNNETLDTRVASCAAVELKEICWKPLCGPSVNAC